MSGSHVKQPRSEPLFQSLSEFWNACPRLAAQNRIRMPRTHASERIFSGAFSRMYEAREGVPMKAVGLKYLAIWKILSVPIPPPPG